jgi:hypothetical protein
MKLKKRSDVKQILSFILFIALALALISPAAAQPAGPAATILGNTTKNTPAGTLINSSINGTTSPGGFIFTTLLNSVQQNTRWKAYVGNVTGTLTLDDASDNTIYQWSISSISGEVYATRASGSINWSGINCTWISDARINSSDGLDNSNRSPEHNENSALSHTSSDDNITSTFNSRNHSAITIGTVSIGKNECFSLNTYQIDAVQNFSDSDAANFTQVVLYDGAYNSTDGNVVYETPIEGGKAGFDNETYDFQMMVPENGLSSFTSSTAYYFYVELT